MTELNQLFCDRVQPQILGIHPYVPGKPVSELQRELGLSYISKLASNENPLGASLKVLTAVQAALKDIARYPDGSAFELKKTLSDFLGVKTEQLAIGNGSNELLELVARAFAGAGDEVIYAQYGFAVYPISAQVVGATGVEVPAVDWGHDLEAMLAAITDKTKLIYIANPNNPTGTLLTRTQWETFISQVPREVVVVLDEAYIEYAMSFDDNNQYPNGCDYLSQYPNLLISRTFSKTYGLASLRVGYLIGGGEIIRYINQLRAPFNVNHLAQVAACTALSDQAFVKKSIILNQQGMRQIKEALAKLNVNYIPSAGNFICIHLGEKALEMNQKLLEEGVIVRPLANYGLMQFLRVSIGTQVENQHFIDALKRVLKNG
ncbi:Biosynthetic Aromatic amino acid aminotransferase beta [hydrothermal vent metagenome]|uniref:Biosynthetic Aromatic amino acid aminotransferase beta n=1 Tax=hydrothermal vent metagenome TaxID=652676 RepID=A0A3B0WB87_9ZZZZ